MKVIIAGTRTIRPAHAHLAVVVEECEQVLGWRFTEVVSGGAEGVDTVAEEWAWRNDLDVKRFAADWDTHGKRAGPIRNREMAAYADALILIWNGQSRGSASMKREAEARGLPIHEVIV